MPYLMNQQEQIKELDYPSISLILPIADRNNFKKLIVSNILKLDYDKSKLELVILDDGLVRMVTDNMELDVLKNLLYPINVIYKYDSVKKSIGHKRNILVKMSSHNVVACLDSDDYYLSNYLKHSISVMQKGKHGIVGSAQMLFMYPNDDFLITGIECSEKRMIHEATMIFSKKHWRSMGGFAKEGTGEGTQMIDQVKEDRIGKTQIKEVMICIAHGSNTVNKDLFKKSQVIPITLPKEDKILILSCLSYK